MMFDSAAARRTIQSMQRSIHGHDLKPLEKCSPQFVVVIELKHIAAGHVQSHSAPHPRSNDDFFADRAAAV